jgi:septum formation protein
MPAPQAAYDFVWLASQSPRRRQLLGQLGVRHELLLPGPEEDAEALEITRPGEAATDYVQRVTLAKLAAARRRLQARGLQPAPILCADTTVVLGRRILGKPADAAEAAAMLGALSGRTHRVMTAVAVAAARGGAPRRALSISRVRFAPLTPAVIAAYVVSGEPEGKAGAYAIQGPLAGWIEHIEGSHSGIMGLPLHETAQLLRAARVRLAL